MAAKSGGRVRVLQCSLMRRLVALRHISSDRRPAVALALACAAFIAFLATACGSDGPDPVAPTPAPAPAPAPAPPPAPAPAPAPAPPPAPIPVDTLTVDPSIFEGGRTSTGTVTLNAAAPATGTLVALATDSGAASVPPFFRIAEGLSVGTFP